MTKRLLERMADRKIGVKLTIAFRYVFETLVLLLFVAAFAALSAMALLRARQQTIQNSALVRTQLESVYDRVDSGLKLTVRDVNSIYHAAASEAPEVRVSVETGQMFTTLDFYRNSFPEISNLIFVGADGVAVSSGPLGMPEEKTLRAFLEEIPALGIAKTVNIQRFENSDLAASENKAAWVLGRRVIDVNTGGNLGWLLAEVDAAVLSRELPNPNSEEYFGSFAIMDRNGVVVASQDLDAIGTHFRGIGTIERRPGAVGETGLYFAGSTIVAYTPLQGGDWYLLNTLGFHELALQLSILLGLILLAGLFTHGLGRRMVREITLRLTEPIEELSETAAQFAAGDLSVRSRVETQDEIGTLSTVFNSMLEQIQTQIRDIEASEKQKRESELALIQSQIKPHFLYNTLNLIYVFCQTGQPEQGARIAKALADYYRSCLSGGREIISLREELKNTADYLLIQKERYQDLLDYAFRVDEEILDCRIPKMTLQPMVENAIYHGIKPKESLGHICVEGQRDGEDIVLRIEDDGVGMENAALRDVLSGQEGFHFGIQSTDRRIRLYFGETYGVSLASVPGEGTSVTIRIPAQSAKALGEAVQ